MRLRIYGEPPGQWTVAWGLDATDIDPATGYRLKVWPASTDPAAVSAFATCVYLKN